MRVLMLDAPQAMIDERRRLGLDGADEMWNGVLHMVPPAGGPHQGLSGDFFYVAVPLARARGLRPLMETGLFRSAQDFRVPDQLYCRAEHFSERGAEGAELVVEVRSDDDDTYRKIPFYAALGVREMIVLYPRPRRVEFYRAREGELAEVSPAADGHWCEVLGLRLQVVDEVLHLSWDGGSAQL
ncbi:MAG: Uma2 family endonuclease [Sporichthyaceae bacterium]